MPDGESTQGGQAAGAAETSSARMSMAAALFGDLHCVSCGYNLKGLSIRSSCPECGVAVRATLLAVVDPRADELSKLRRPGLVAAALLAWVWAAAVAGACVWLLRVGDVVALWRPIADWPSGLLTLGAVVGAGVSGAATLALVKPDDRSPRSVVRGAALAVVGYVPLVWVTRFTLTQYDPMHGPPLGMMAQEFDPVRALLRLAVWVSVALVIVGMRARTKRLFYRSYVIRTGRVPNQPLSAVLAAVGVAAAGDVVGAVGVGLAGGLVADIAATLGLVLSAAGSFLFLIGLVGLSVDAWRVSRAIRRPPPGLVDVFSGRADDDTAAGEAAR